MTTTLPAEPASQSTTPSPGASETLSPVDAQRAALRDLVSLATECAATEARIDRELQAVVQDATELAEKNGRSAVYRSQTLRDQVKQQHEAALAEIEQRYATELEAIRKVEWPARKSAEAELERVEQLVQKKVQEGVWLADSDLEVTLNQLAAEQKRLQAEVDHNLDSVAKTESEALQRAANYGYRGGSGNAAAAEAATPNVPTAGATDAANVDPSATFSLRREEVDQAVSRFRALTLPKLFVGVTPFLILILFCAIAAGLAWYLGGMGSPDLKQMGIYVGGTFAVLLTLGLLLRSVSRKQVNRAVQEVNAAVAAARQAAKVQLEIAAALREKARERAVHRREGEIRFSKEKYTPALLNAQKKLHAALQLIEEQVAAGRAQAEAQRDQMLAEAITKNERAMTDTQRRIEQETQGGKLTHDRQISQAQNRYDLARTTLEKRLIEGLATIQAPMETAKQADDVAPADWESAEWATWKPSRSFASTVKFGQLHVDLLKIARSSSESAEVRLALPPPFDMPATLAFPKRASLLIQADREGRADAIRAIQMVMARLLVSLPPGRVRFTLLDPVGLGQNFAGFMHLADHDDQLVGGRIWTETEQIDQRLNNLTGHMETVIQKYLRNEFETIDDYNAQAGELAEPYRFLVISDFPASFTDDALRRLSSIATSGARCGVYTLVYYDTRQNAPLGTTYDDLIANSVNLVREGEQFVWRDPVFEQFPLRLDPPPSELALTKILDVVGRGAKEAARVEVSFDTIAPPPGRMWTQDSGSDLTVPIGRLGATRLQYMKLGKGVAQHVLIAGKTGSGKSTLLHTLVTNLALWYGPDQVEFYLIDFKKGVEFKTYATYALPHARAIAVESDREFGLSVLQRLDAELTRRGELYRAAGVQDLASYRKTPNPQVMPRTLLMVDEFQEFFSEDDKLAQDSSVLLDRLVRQGRAFGIHVLLGSQTIAGASGLPRSTIGQMAVRIALQTSDADSQLILGDNNSAARLLSRPGEAIYNDQGGLVEGNSPFQIAWLPDQRKERYLGQIQVRNEKAAIQMGHPIVFEGNAPADLSLNRRLAELFDAPNWLPLQGPPRAWVGEPVAIKEPTSVAMRRQSGANLLVIGQQEDAALATMLAAVLSLAAQMPKGQASFYILDATPADSTFAGSFAALKDVLPHEVNIVDWRAVPEAINTIATEMTRRRDEQELAAPAVFLFVYGLQRYRILRKAEDDFSFSMGSGGDEPKPADPGKQFAELLKEGPPVGIHTLAWADTAIAVDRTLDRGSLREFDNRVLFQMSANDSSSLIDSPAANKLGFYRALAYSEEQGVMEKFRPYAVPPAEWLEQVKQKLHAKA